MTKWLDEAATLEPSAYVQYLRTRGWTHVELGPRSPFTRFTLTVGDQQAEIDVPNHFDWGDYRRRIHEVVAVLLEVEQVGWPELLGRLRHPSCDEFRLRLTGLDRTSGEIGLDDAIRLRVARRQMLLSVAHSVVEPRAHFSRLTRKQPMTFVDRCHELPARPGSYVSSVRIPVEPAVTDGEDEPLPFARRATEKLALALTTVGNAVARGLAEPLLDASGEGISSNFLTALTQLRPNSDLGSIEFDLVWSRARSLPKQQWQPLRLGASSFDMLKSAAAWLRENAPIENVTLEGHVISLSRSEDAALASEAVDGTIVLLTSLDDHPNVKVHFELSGVNHELAMQAYRAGARVAVHGTLAREGRAWWLRQPGQLAIIAWPDDDDDFSES